MRQQVSTARCALRQAHDFNAEGVVNENQQLHIPWKHGRERVWAECTFAGDTQWQARQLHAYPRLATGCFQLGTGSADVPRKGTQLVSVEARDMGDGAAQCRLQNRGDDPFLAVLGQQGHFLPCVG